VIFSSAAILYDEYGSESPRAWKALKLLLVSLAFKCIFIQNKEQTPSASIGGVYSSLVSRTNNHQATGLSYPALWANFLSISDCSQALAIELRSKSFKNIFIYNGRFASARPIVDFCNSNDIKCTFIEYGNIPFHFTLQEYPIHDFTRQCRDTIAIVDNNLNFPCKYEYSRIKDEYFNLLTRNKFSGHDEHLALYDVCIFLSSPHELMYTYKGKEMETDASLCRQVLLEFGRDKTFAIKVHPNMLLDRAWPAHFVSLTSLSSEGYSITVFGPNSKVSALKLINSSQYIIIPSSSLALVAECQGKYVDMKQPWRPLLGDLLEYSRNAFSDLPNKRTLLQLLYLVFLHINQEPYHPFWNFFLKIFGSLDSLFVKKRNLGLRR